MAYLAPPRHRDQRSVFVSAGEVSGDRAAAPVVAELGARLPDLRFFGAGGQSLAAAGMELRHPLDRLAVTGVREAVGRLRGVSALLLDSWREIRRCRPALALLVDYPGANLRLAWLLRRAGVPVLYYVAPQRWAWLSWRAPALAGLVDHLAVTLPFEREWFAARGVPTTYVGHPLLDTFHKLPSEQVRVQLQLDRRPVVALLPGSRINEVARHLPLLCAAMRRLPGVQPVLAVTEGEQESCCRQLAPHIARGSAEQALSVADAALCASGSATLETVLARVPTAVFYRLSPVSYALARRLVRVPHVALPNLLSGALLMPELLQDQMTPISLADATERLLTPAEAARQRTGMAAVEAMLSPAGAARRVADLAQELL